MMAVTIAGNFELSVDYAMRVIQYLNKIYNYGKTEYTRRYELLAILQMEYFLAYK